MAKLLVYYAHPGERFSRVNKPMRLIAQDLPGITFVDLYAEYPRADIDVAREQARLLDHELIVFQHPLYWYSTPSLVKQWIDLVLEHGFAYGAGGDRLAGKAMMLALTAGGPASSYSAEGYQHFTLRTFLTPLEQTARLCQMRFLPPYVLFGSLHAAENGDAKRHAEGYRTLLEALRDDRFDHAAAADRPILTADDLPLLQPGG